MSKLTTEQRSAILSVRAKARKALNVTDANLPASVSKHLEAVITWADGQLKVAPVASAKPAKGKTSKAAKKTTKRATKKAA